MKKILLLLALGLAGKAPAQYLTGFKAYLTSNRQVLFVKTPSAQAIQGSMYLFERNDLHSRWKIKDSFAVVVGRAGLAKDSQSNLSLLNHLPLKKEGDGRSPAGIFPLGEVFSYHALSHLHMPFRQADTMCYCVDDPNSPYYNTLIVADTAKQAYSSFEYMKRRDDFYEYGVWVLYNSQPVVKGNGSCIFLHVWKNENSGTSGCTAMSKEHIIELIHWLDKKKNPVLLQVAEE